MKTIPSFRNYFKYLFLLGPILFIVGLVAGFVSSNWSFFPVGTLLTLGAIVTALWLVFLGQGFWGRRSTQAGTNALVATLAILVILGLVNFLATRYNVRLDLTENLLYTLSPQTQQIVKNLQQPLQVFIFDNNPTPSDRELLENYRRYNSKFSFKFVDPQIEVDLVKDFNVKSFGEVYFKYGEKKQLVQTLYSGNRFNLTKGLLSEVKLTNGIEKIQRDITIPVYFLSGHGEATLEAEEGGLSQAVSSLEDKGYKVQSLNLAQVSQVPQDAGAIVIANPQRALLPGEVKALQDYLNAGGRLLLMLDPKNNAGLEPLLADWGVKLDDRIVIDASGSNIFLGYGVDTTLITDYGKHPIAKDFDQDISLYYRARAIGTVPVPGVKAVPLLITDKKTWAESELTSEVKFDPDRDIEGPLNLGVVLTRTSSSSASDRSEEKKAEEKPEKDQEKSESRLVVFGNSTFATNGWFRRQLNGDVFLNSINWLVNNDEKTISISPKEPKNRRINLTPNQASIIFFLALLIMPLLGLIAAGVTWWQRR